jgi:hypothetical protein
LKKINIKQSLFEEVNIQVITIAIGVGRTSDRDLNGSEEEPGLLAVV